MNPCFLGRSDDAVSRDFVAAVWNIHQALFIGWLFPTIYGTTYNIAKPQFCGTLNLGAAS